MTQFSYTASPALRFNLKTLEDIRRDILLLPIAPKIELRARWENRLRHLSGILALAGYPFSKRDILDTLAATRKMTDERVIIERLHRALSYIGQEWLVTERPLSFSTIETLVSMAFPKSTRLYTRRINANETALRQLLEYVDNEKEHALTRAAICYIGIVRMNPFDEDSVILASLASHLVLAKGGFDARGMLTPQPVWASDKTAYGTVTAQAVQTGNYTDWLNWAAQTSVTTLERARDTLTGAAQLRDIQASFFDINDRQKVILVTLEEPNRKITNKDVQKKFRVSQITASRDLSKLAQLGLLYPHGKGRSVYYTRV